MDPASGVIAFVGFAASLVTLAEVLVKGCKALSSVKAALENAPGEVERLYRAMLRLQRVIVEVKRLGEDVEEQWDGSDVSLHWLQHVQEVEADIFALGEKLTKLEAALTRKSYTSMNVRARIMKLFMDHELGRYERILASHQDTFAFLLGVISEIRTRAILSEVRGQTKRLQRLSRRTIEFHSKQEKRQAVMASGLDRPAQLAYEISQQLDMTVCHGPEEWQAKQLVRFAVHGDTQLFAKPLRDTRAPKPTAGYDIADSVDHLPPPYPAATVLPGARAFMSGHWMSQRCVILCHVFNVEFPLGTVTTRLVRKEVATDGGHRKKALSWQLEVAIYPLRLLSNMVVQLKLGSGGHGGFTFHLRPRLFNRDPELKACLDVGDMGRLRSLFSSGKASPHDLMAPYGNTLLHEAVWRRATGVPNMLEVAQLLLSFGVSPNQLNASGRTCLLQCCRFMRESDKLGESMRPMASLMIANGSELSLCDEEGNSACTLLFQSQDGLRYMEEFVYRFVDLNIYDDLQTADYWLISSLARCMPTFQGHLEAQLRDYRTPREISSDTRPRQKNLLQLDAQQQIAWLKGAKKEDRVPFMRAICSHGTMQIVGPFVASGIDLDETEAIKKQTYIRSAARTGNLDVVHALLEAGASVDQDDLYMTPYVVANSVVDDLMERWNALAIGRPGYGWEKRTAESEHWILPSLLQSPTFKGPNSLIAALWWEASPAVFRRLVESGCGRRDGQPPGSYYQRVLGSEVIEAVKLCSPHLQAMLDAGLALECEDRLGCTALLHALDMGAVDMVRILIDAGANLTRETGYGITPLQFAESNLKASHPRPMQRSWINKFEWQNRYRRKVSLEEDQTTYHVLKSTVKYRGRGELSFLSYRHTSSCTLPSIQHVLAALVVGLAGVLYRVLSNNKAG